MFPPPPPRGAKGPGAAHPEDRRGAEADPEREAFNAELDKLAGEMEKVRHKQCSWAAVQCSAVKCNAEPRANFGRPFKVFVSALLECAGIWFAAQAAHGLQCAPSVLMG